MSETTNQEEQIEVDAGIDTNEVAYINAEIGTSLLGQISVANQQETIDQIVTRIQTVPRMPTIYRPKKQKSPYEITDRQIFDLYINGYGLDLNAYSAFASLLAIMRARGVIIRTNVIGTAQGVAGLLAVQGTPGFRIMYETSYIVPYSVPATRRVVGFSEVVAGYQPKPDATNSDAIKLVHSIYSDNSKLSMDEIRKMTQDGKPISAYHCLKNGMCDWVLQSNGKIRGR